MGKGERNEVYERGTNKGVKVRDEEERRKERGGLRMDEDGRRW